MTKQKIIKVGTDCSGIEAPIKALEQLGIPFKHVFSSEIDKYCIQSIKANYNSDIIFGDPEGPYPEGDITKRDVNTIPNIDLYVAGFPCQPFSSAGLKKGFDDKRGNVFWSCLEVIKTKKPSFFILENVRALLWHDRSKSSPAGSYGNTWKIIWEALSKLKEDGYDVQWKLMNTREYGIPQNRQRIYIIGTKKGEFIWPEKTEYKLSLKECVDHDTPGGKTTSEKLKKYIDRFPTCCFADVCQSQYGNSCNEEYSPCITASNSLWCIPMSRYASPKELLTLQGFESFNKVVSNTQMKKQLGNSMSVNVLEEIFKNLL